MDENKTSSSSNNGSICIITPDIVGPVKNGGIGTSYYHLACFLAESNFEVTILFAGRPTRHDQWLELYAKHNIDFLFLPEPSLDLIEDQRRKSYAVYEFLKTNTYDIVHFPEWTGLAYYSLQAKTQGLLLQNTVVCVTIHSPSIWNALGNDGVNVSFDFLIRDFMEQQSVSAADVLISPSRNLRDWVVRHGWTDADRAKILQYIIPYPPEKEDTIHPPKEIDEVVFFGRLEPRKGIREFISAVEILANESGLKETKITFLGRKTPLIEEIIHNSAKTWPFSVQLITDFNALQAIDYLKDGNRMAVMPSRIDNLPLTVFECLSNEIPFVSSNTGGIPEQIHPDDHQPTICDLQPDKLAKLIFHALKNGHRPARFAAKPSETKKECLHLHLKMATDARKPQQQVKLNKPLVSVCLTHYDRPRMLEQAIQAYARQTYKNFELIIVDDGSKKTESEVFLDTLEKKKQNDIELKIIRQQNRYPGAARNTAAKAARGKYLLFADDDNIPMSHEIETFVKTAEYSKADMLVPIVTRFSGDRPPADLRNVSAWLPLAGCASYGFTRNILGDAHFFILRESFDKIGGFTEERIGFEDYEFQVRAKLEGLHIQVIPEPLFWYRMTQAGVGKNYHKHANQLRVTRTYMHYIPTELKPLMVDLTVNWMEMHDLGHLPLKDLLGFKLKYKYPYIYNVTRSIFRRLKNLRK